MGYLGNQITTVFPTSISVDSATISGNASVGGTSTLTGAVNTGTSLTVANGLTLSDGNMTLASGHGIDFSATSDASGGGMASELLDDYEEGTWSPSLNAYSGTPTISNAEYVKSGNLVLVACRVLLDGTADSSRFEVASLPFTSANSVAGVFGGGVSYTNSSFSRNIYVLVSTNTTKFGLYEESASNLSYTEVGTSKEIRLYAIYKSQ